MRDADVYDSGFYRNQQDGSRESALQVVPMLVQRFAPRSVIDVGCGVGWWLKAFQAAGVAEVMGVDGGWVTHKPSELAKDSVVIVDLKNPFDVGRCFDLALCLEVAEHLPAASADGLVSSLVRVAPIVVFGAAIPGQGGTMHINEQWPEYWARLFRQNGFVVSDCLRPRLWTMHTVKFWYAQNMMVYAREDLARRLNLPDTDLPLPIVHPEAYRRSLEVAKELRAESVYEAPLKVLARAAFARVRRNNA